MPGIVHKDEGEFETPNGYTISKGDIGMYNVQVF
jgi:hypothetical protein